MMIGFATILLLGVGAQWLAWRVRLPSILLLLLFGFAAGPLTDHFLVDPDVLLGDALLPLVSLSVAVILLEGGLSLRWRELRGAGGAVRNLILLGVPLTWGLTTLLARWTLDLDWRISLLLGAILVVTGPTVIIPLLHHVRPSGAVGSVVRWEGIVGDPIGAILAVLVFQGIVLAPEGATSLALAGLGKAILAGGGSGAIGAGLVVQVLKKDLVPDYLHAALVLAVGIGVFVAAHEVQHESGLLAVTVLGVILANQRQVAIEHIVEFKENLRVLLISCLFILLAARLPLEELTSFDPRIGLFVALLILVVRPAMAFLSTIGTSLSWRERVFVAWMAPRGIVAAAVASVFALQLATMQSTQGDRLVSIVFAVIVGTVAVYGLTAAPLARALGLATREPQGVLLLGAHNWSREIAQALRSLKIDVLLVDTNHHEVQKARIEGLRAHYGNALAEDFELRVPLDALGSLVCLTRNDEVNALACLRFGPLFGRAKTWQLAPDTLGEREEQRELPRHLRGKVLFSAEVDFWDLRARFRDGAVVKVTRLGEEFGLADFVAAHERPDAPVIPLFMMNGDGRLVPFTAGEAPKLQAGDRLIAVVDPSEEE